LFGILEIYTMPLEERLAENTASNIALIAALNANTAALVGISSTAKATRGGTTTEAPSAPSSDAKTEAPAETGRRRGRPPADDKKPAVDETAAKMEKFKEAVVNWINWDDPSKTEAEVTAEREDRKTWIALVSIAFKVERASLIPIESHETVLAGMERFGDGDEVDPASLLPAPAPTVRRRGA
jgi:hypothetical protein